MCSWENKWITNTCTTVDLFSESKNFFPRQVYALFSNSKHMCRWFGFPGKYARKIRGTCVRFSQKITRTGFGVKRETFQSRKIQIALNSNSPCRAFSVFEVVRITFINHSPTRRVPVPHCRERIYVTCVPARRYRRRRVLTQKAEAMAIKIF